MCPRILTLAAAVVVCAALLVASVSVMGGAAEKRMATGPGDRALAQQLVSGTMSAYRSYTRMAFTDGVSGDYPGDKYAFVNRVEKSFYSARPFQVDFFINEVSQTDDKLAVSFTWNKKVVVRSTGQQRKSSGRCTFVYRNESGAWRLYDIKGQSPL